ncbi:hypothetical protein ACGIF2_16725 [Cellulomonas sp. P22]|uniref:hypothetical protein n=1 Tax=Cellulomonas sp. P22 TaxID=3373189 RepID=UPI0037B9B043
MSDMWGQGEAFEAEIAYRRERLYNDTVGSGPRRPAARHGRDPRVRVRLWRVLRGAAVRG